MDGINVKREKKAIYLRLALDPSTTISLLIEFFTSKKNKKKKYYKKNYIRY